MQGYHYKNRERKKKVSCSVMSNSLRLNRLLCLWDFSRQEYQSGLPFPFPGDLPDSSIEPRSPALQANSLLVVPPEDICIYMYVCVYKYIHTVCVCVCIYIYIYIHTHIYILGLPWCSGG